MHKDTPRQLVHLSGLIFVFIGLHLNRSSSAIMFFGVAVFFYLYGEYVSRSKPIFGLRRLAFFFEKRKSSRPFSGALWFYIGSGISFALFPLMIAVASSAILAVGDSFSTMFGLNFGKHKLVGEKSVEGSGAFLIGAFLIALLFLKPSIAFAGAFTGMLVEAFIPPKLGGKKTHWFLDDNLLIPIVSGAVIFVLSLLI